MTSEQSLYTMPRNLEEVYDRVFVGLDKIRGSFFLFILGIGVGLVIVGSLLRTGVVAGMFGIWGATLVVYAGLGFLGMRIIGYR